VHVVEKIVLPNPVHVEAVGDVEYANVLIPDPPPTQICPFHAN